MNGLDPRQERRARRRRAAAAELLRGYAPPGVRAAGDTDVGRLSRLRVEEDRERPGAPCAGRSRSPGPGDGSLAVTPPPAVTTRVPRDVQARILREIIASQHPRLALPSIALNHHLTLDDVQVIANAGGYPDKTRMRQAVEKLAATAAQDPPPTAAGGGDPGPVYGLREVPVADLHADPGNIRDHLGGREEFDELAESIAEVGLLQPIVARLDGDRLVVVAGHRRLTAVKMLGWGKVEVIVRAPMRPDDVVAAMLIENSHRRDLDPIEEARGLLKLLHQLEAESGEKISHQRLGRKVGRNQVFVSQRLALLDLDPAIQDELRGGQITLGAAVAKGRLDAGRVRPGARGKASAQHLSGHHELSNRAQARCTAAGHKAKGSASVGGIACGKCWESVIRADERRSLQDRSASTGLCALCDTPTGAEVPA